MPETQFAFTVEEVFYIKPPIDRVIMVGTVQDGSVKVGDSVVVHAPAGVVPVVVETIESPKEVTLNRRPRENKSGCE